MRQRFDLAKQVDHAGEHRLAAGDRGGVGEGLGDVVGVVGAEAVRSFISIAWK
jgi:hypothetical protein